MPRASRAVLVPYGGHRRAAVSGQRGSPVIYLVEVLPGFALHNFCDIRQKLPLLRTLPLLAMRK